MKNTTTYCDTDTCSSCGAIVETWRLEENGECRPCATFTHNLRLMAAGVGRDKATGRYAKVAK